MHVITKVTAAVTVIVLGAGAFVLGGGRSAAADCTSGRVDVNAVAALSVVAGYRGDQLANAAHIMNAATALGMSAHGQTIGVMTAMGESSLRVLDHGDDIGPDSRGLFQQRESWGTLAERMDPTVSAELFYARLQTIAGWDAMQPTAAAHAVQRNSDPEHYTPFFAPAAAVVQAIASNAARAGCGISDDRIQLARDLVVAADEGRLRGLVPDHIKQIRWIAQGQAVPDCSIDTRVLQIITIALDLFDQVGVSDINRKCTGQIAGAGQQSSHWINGGGGAVDFYSLGGRSTTGADGNAVRLVGLLDSVVPAGSRVGQSNCRAAAGTTVALENFSEIRDTCHHLHVDVAYAHPEEGINVAT